MMIKPNTVEELADGLERYMLDTKTLDDIDFDMLNIAAISLRKAAVNAPELMKKVLAEAVTLSRQAEIFAESMARKAMKGGK